MDPVFVVLDALASSARSAADGGSDLLADACARLSQLVGARLGGGGEARVLLSEYESDPAAWRARLAEALSAAGAGDDEAVITAAREVLALRDPVPGDRTGLPEVDLRCAKGAQVGDGNVQFNVYTGELPVAARAWGYLEWVQEIAPPALIGRDAELEGMARFCLDPGPDAYMWWQAGPWAGKTALASWFVTHPPAGVDVVSFFITGRLVSQAGAEAFLDAMIAQLAALKPGTAIPTLPAGGHAGTWLSLLASAAGRSRERERRLVVVIDGLDEDDVGAAPARGRPSIASLLPRLPPPGARFIITSRPDPGLPDDLPGGHPLRACRPSRLDASPVARDAELLARQELRSLLAGDQVTIDTVGFIAASGGGLTRNDLSKLIGTAPYKLDSIMRGVSGRSLHAIASADPRSPRAAHGNSVYLFGHETLRVTAEEQLGQELSRYRQRIGEWINTYAQAGWPDSAPSYAARAYPQLLVATGNQARLLALARDRHRHAFLTRTTGSDEAALTEIENAQNLIANQEPVDLQAVAELGTYRQLISKANEFIPAGLPAAWAQLARFDHAEALARILSRLRDQVLALTDVAIAVAQAGDQNRACRLADEAEARARTLTGPQELLSTFTEIATAVARAGDRDRACRLAEEAEAMARALVSEDNRAWGLATVATAIAATGDHDRAVAAAAAVAPASRAARDWALAGVAAAIAGNGDYDRGEALARAIVKPSYQAHALAAVAAAVTRAGYRDRACHLADEAESLIGTQAEPTIRAHDLGKIADVLACAGDWDRARRLAGAVEAIVRAHTDDPYRGLLLVDVAATFARAGDGERAEVLARDIFYSNARASALARVATALAGLGEHNWARELADDAETLARACSDRRFQEVVLSDVAIALVRTDNGDRAEALVRNLAIPDLRASALAGVAAAFAEVNCYDRARQLASDAATAARAVTGHFQPITLAEVAPILAAVGNHNEAEDLARTISDTEAMADALSGVAAAIARAGDYERAEALARDISIPELLAPALAKVAAAVALGGNREYGRRLAADAEDVARSISHHDARARVLAGVAVEFAAGGDREYVRQLAAVAEDVARTSPSARDDSLADLAGAVARIGDFDRAEALACVPASPGFRATALANVAAAIAQAGNNHRADRLLSQAIIMGGPDIWWLTTLAQSFSTSIGPIFEILIDAYA